MQGRLPGTVGDQIEGLGDEPEGLLGGGERRGPVGGAQDVGAGGVAQLGGIGIVRQQAVGVEPVGGDDLGQLVAAEPGEVIGGGQMQALALAPAERVAGDRAHHVLHEAVLAALGGARIGLDGDELLAGQRRRASRRSRSAPGRSPRRGRRA